MHFAVCNTVAVFLSHITLPPKELDNMCGFLLRYKSIWPDPKLLSKMLVSASKLKALILISLKLLASRI